MDRRWPWKKKSDKSEKSVAATVDSLAASLVSADSQVNQEKQDNNQKPKYVQITVESYSHLTGLEDQVKTYEEHVQAMEDEIKELNEKLSEANLEITTKEDLVKQHTKVAEEAVSGWEKAEAEALALKNSLESVTLLKLTAEDKASHLDGALKECMRQIRNLKEEHEQKIQDVVLTKNKQCERIKLELEARIAGLDQELLKVDAENDAMSRSLQDRSNMVIKLRDEKSQAEAEIEQLKSNIESCEREINSLKYELHVLSKEVDIRTEEKNMSMRSAEVANKHHMEGAKKIAKLEAECQRLRVLVRKKLPGPAALAQMKIEVESLGRDYGDTRLRRSPARPSSPHMAPVSDFSFDFTQKLQKDNEFLTERILAMEEETKMLKEALAKRNNELQASRNLCAKTVSKLQSLEAQQRSSPKGIAQSPTEGYSSLNASNPPSLTSVSEDGNDDVASCAESWATALMPENGQVKKEKSIERLSKTERAKSLDLMDDFLEMEMECANGKPSEIAKTTSDASEAASAKDVQSDKQNMNLSVTNHDSDADELPVLKLRAKISMVLESLSKDVELKRALEDIKRVLQDAEFSNSTCNGQVSSTDSEKETLLPLDSKVDSDTVQIISQELTAAIAKIHDFVLLLGKEASIVEDTNDLSQKIEEFSVTFKKVSSNERVLADLVFDLSHVLAKASELKFRLLGYNGDEVEISSPDCIDKVALPEHKVPLQQDFSGERYQNGCAHISNPEVPDDVNLVSHYEANTSPCKVPLEEFEELKSERKSMADDLARCTENLEMTKSQLHETEQLLAETKSQLASAQRTNSLASTQLKCMAESYNSLETRAAALENEVSLLRGKIETVEKELQDEKQSHQDAVAKCKELEEQLQRNESCSVCAAAAADDELKTKQERELAAAAEKLAECQETIFLLGKQLNSFRPQTETTGSTYNERPQKGETEEPPRSSNIQDTDRVEIDTATSANNPKTGGESPVTTLYSSPCSPSADTEGTPRARSPLNSKAPKHRHTKSGSSSTSSTPTPEKNQRGFSRFFSSKGKSGH